MPKTSREIICQDALTWLNKQKKFPAILTSLPEMEEMNMNIKDYEVFFRDAVAKCIERVDDSGYCIFTQTDRKHHGWVDKSYWITDVATSQGWHMVWKKISINQTVGKVSLFRPPYSYMLCYTKKGSVGKSLPDIIESGPHLYTHGFGLAAIALCVQYLKNQGVKLVVDPFVGQGTTAAVANLFGLNAIGVDIDPKQCKAAKKLELTLEDLQE